MVRRKVQRIFFCSRDLISEATGAFVISMLMILRMMWRIVTRMGPIVMGSMMRKMIGNIK